MSIIDQNIEMDPILCIHTILNALSPYRKMLIFNKYRLIYKSMKYTIFGTSAYITAIYHCPYAVSQRSKWQQEGAYHFKDFYFTRLY